MKESESFNAQSIHRDDPSRKTRLRYWNNDLCHRRPHTFDIVIAVRRSDNRIHVRTRPPR